MKESIYRSRFWLSSLLVIVLISSCDNGSSTGGFSDNCSVNQDLFSDGGVGKDGIPALTDPTMIPANDVTYLRDTDRVIGLVVEGAPIAVPHNILWWHEIANYNFSSLKVAVSYCPLTGSSLAFDRGAVNNADFGVSGLLFQSNLTMYDRNTDESLWPQMNRKAGCGSRDGLQLSMVPVIEMTWAGWKEIHPNTVVISSQTGYSRTYTALGYPYGNYETENNATLLVSVPIDTRRPPKERVLGIPGKNGGSVYPFGLLKADSSGYNVVNDVVDGEKVVVLWDDAKKSAMAYRPRAGGQDLVFEVKDSKIVDKQTESTWRVDGLATEGAMAGVQLEPVAEAYIAFWFAWAEFNKGTRLWDGV